VALTSVAVKVFGCIVLRYLNSAIDGLLDQFAYQIDRSVDDAATLGLHHISKHLERPGAYARIVFIGFSSAFNTSIPFKPFD